MCTARDFGRFKFSTFFCNTVSLNAQWLGCYYSLVIIIHTVLVCVGSLAMEKESTTFSPPPTIPEDESVRGTELH